MAKFPVDAPKRRVIKALQRLGFSLIREEEHIALLRENADGSRTPLTIPTTGRSRDPHYGLSAPRQASLAMNF